MGENTTKRMEFLINGRRLLPIDETAHYLGISKRTLYGKGSKAPKPKRFGRKLLWDAGELRTFVESLSN